jgi:hypothetical protein
MMAIKNGGKLDPMTMTMPTEADNVRTRNWITWEAQLILSGIATKIERILTLAKA